MSVRAKFKCTSVTEREFGGGKTVKDIELAAVMPPYKDGKPDPEHPNASFFAASPSGALKMGVLNPIASAQFAVGREYFIDFTPAD